MKSIFRKVSILLVLCLTLGIFAVPTIADEPAADNGLPQVFYFTDLMCPLVHPHMIDNISDGKYQITYYSGNVWNIILSQLTNDSSSPNYGINSLFSIESNTSGWSVLNTGTSFVAPEDNTPATGSLIIIELRNYYADGYKLDILFEQLKNAGYDV